MEKQYILMAENSEMTETIRILFADVMNNKDFMFVSTHYTTDNKILKLLLSDTSKKYFKNFFEYCLTNRFMLYKLLKKNHKKKQNVVIFLNSSFKSAKYSQQILSKIKKKFKCKFVLLYWDSIFAPASQMANELVKITGLFDLIFAIDSQDIKDGIIKTCTPYSKLEYKQGLSPETSNCLYFVGWGKGREQIIQEIAKNAETNGIKTSINLKTDKRESFNGCSNINFMEKTKPYSDVIEDIHHTNCILDINQKGQSAYTLRIYEAICYNKKLLTNNPKVKELKYYNPEYIKIFKTADEIDWSWVCKKEKVEYNYKNDFSPIHFFSEIRKNI